MGERKILVADTNIWIDLYVGEIVLKVFELPFTLVSPDVIVAEELIEPDGSFLVTQGLKVCPLDGRGVERVYKLSRLYTRPSKNDLFALVLAENLRATLLTGDNSLRTAAIDLGIDVRGTLWLMDELVANKIIGKTQAARSLKRMIKQDRRLPRDECEVRIKKWTKE